MLTQISNEAEFVAAEIGLRQRHTAQTDPPQLPPMPSKPGRAKGKSNTAIVFPRSPSLKTQIPGTKRRPGMKIKDSAEKHALHARNANPLRILIPAKSSKADSHASFGTLSSVSVATDASATSLHSLVYDDTNEGNQKHPSLTSREGAKFSSSSSTSLSSSSSALLAEQESGAGRTENPEVAPPAFDSPVPPAAFLRLGLRVPNASELSAANDFRTKLKALRATRSWQQIPLSMLVDQELDDTDFDDIDAPFIDIDAKPSRSRAGRQPKSPFDTDSSSASDNSVAGWVATLFPCLQHIVS